MNAPKLRFKNYNDSYKSFLFGEIVTNKSEKYNPTLQKENLKCIELEHLSSNTGQLLGYTNSSEQASIKNVFKSDSVLYGKLRPYLNKFHFTKFDGVCSSEIWVLNSKNKNLINHYLYYLIQTNRFSKDVSKAIGSKMPRADWQSLTESEFLIPNIDEQNKISKFLEVIDTKIRLQQEKIDLLKEQKKGYLKKIFNQELRFKDENGQEFPEWNHILVKDVLSLNLREVPKPTSAYTRLGLRSHAKGTFHDLVSDVKSVNMDTLYEVHEGDFIINITFAWEQALAIADKEDHGKLVSHRFPTYRFNETHDKNFYKHFFTTKYFKYCLGNASPGGAGRNRVLNKTDFMKIEITVPSLKEQIKISKFLDTLQLKIGLGERTLQTLKDQKKSFMQQMFI